MIMGSINNTGPQPISSNGNVAEVLSIDIDPKKADTPTLITKGMNKSMR